MVAFQWTPKVNAAAIALAEGYTQVEAAAMAGVSDRTLRRWLAQPEFAVEVDKLTLITGIARKAERVKLAKRVIRTIGETTEKDLLDWLKYIELATDGLKIGLSPELTELATLLRDAGILAGIRPRGTSGPSEG